MSSGGKAPQSPAGHDILARYLAAYSRARKMTELERPWGLNDDGLDDLWLRLSEALDKDPEELDHIVSTELSDEDREHIAGKLLPLVFALPFRDYPSEVRAIRTGQRLHLLLRRFPRNGTKKSGGSASSSKQKTWEEQPMGFLPSAMTAPFSSYLRKILHFEDDEQRHVAMVSSNGRRSRVRVTMLAHQRGIVIRFLEKLPSPVEK